MWSRFFNKNPNTGAAAPPSGPSYAESEARAMRESQAEAARAQASHDADNARVLAERERSAKQVPAQF